MELADFPFLDLEVPERYCEEPRGKFLGNWRALARPNDEAELVELLKYANENAIPVVPYGGGTGLVGGQIYTQSDGAICLSMERFKSIELQGNTALVGAGVVLDELHEALEGTGFHFPLSLASSGSAQIGGLIATNAGGVHVIRYGNMGEQVLGLRAYLADGQIVDRTQNLRKDNTGYQLDRMMIGSEGSLGVIAAARLKLVRVDDDLTTCLATVESPEKAYEVLQKLSQGHAPINAFELISGTSWQFLQETGLGESPIGAPDWSLLVEVAGSIDAFEPVLDDLGDTALARTEMQRAALWILRENIPLANRKIGAIASHDISLPISKISEFLRLMPERLAVLDDMRINAFGHMGDGNLHFNLFPAQGREKASYDAQTLSQLVYQSVVEFGGSISAEHGIGRLKGAVMRANGQGDKLDIMARVKAALDPKGILNPGVYE